MPIPSRDLNYISEVQTHYNTLKGEEYEKKTPQTGPTK